MLSLCIPGGFIVCPVTAMASVAQATIKVSGQVVDQDGEPLIGATVKVKGAPQSGGLTDFNGNFSVTVSGDATLVISYIGYNDREVAVRGRANLGTIQMESDSQLLEQVVVNFQDRSAISWEHK